MLDHHNLITGVELPDLVLDNRTTVRVVISRNKHGGIPVTGLRNDDAFMPA